MSIKRHNFSIIIPVFSSICAFLIIFTFTISPCGCRTITTLTSEKDHISPENELISHLLQEDDEMEEEQNEILGQIEIGKDSVGSKKSIRNKIKSSRVKLPAYLNEQFGQVGVVQVDEEEDDVGDDGPVARVWLPVEIREPGMLDNTSFTTRKNASGLSIMFQQTQNLGDFVSAEIVLTTNGDHEEASVLQGLPLRLSGQVKAILLSQQQQENHTISRENSTTITPSPSHPITETIQISSRRRPVQKFYVLNITQPLKKALISSEKLRHPRKFSVELNLLGNDGENYDDFHSALLLQLFDLQVERPFIVFYYREIQHEQIVPKKIDTNHHRRKRSIPVAGQNSTTNGTTNSTTTSAPPPTPSSRAPNHLCKRVTWEVDTHDDIEWYDMVTPRKLELGYCAGNCPFPLQSDHFNYTLHTFFKDRHRLLKIFDVPKNFPKSCCVPISYKPIIAWIMEEENSYAYREFHDVVVDQCGCR